MRTDVWHLVHERDHYELYVDGVFFCSGDTVGEVMAEYENWCAQKEEEEP